MHGTLPRSSSRLQAGRFADWPLAAKSIGGFWLFYALTVVARAFLGSDPLTILSNKFVTLIAGVVLTTFIYLAIVLFSGRASIRRQGVVAGIASLLAGFTMAAFLIAVEGSMRESREVSRVQAREGMVIVEKGRTVRVERTAQEPLVLTLPQISELDANKKLRIAADAAVIWLFFFAAWSAFYLALKSQEEVLTARRRAVEAESAARSAQVRALRYQVNPHFLFNTLNSLSSLVMANRPDEAESMILKLSNFFRSSLSLDPAADVTLAEEIALQRLYLDIEKVRFPRRLKVQIDVPSELESARVPALILQPVVENAIKYGVSGTRESVTLTIVAREAGPGRFTIDVSNSAATPLKKKVAERPQGTGLGLANVSQRLEARFGAAAHCTFGPAPDGGYRVLMTLPLDRNDG